MHLCRDLSRVVFGVFASALLLGGCSTTTLPVTPAIVVSQRVSERPVITGIITETTAETGRIIVQTSAPIQYTAFTLQDPPRVVLDIADAVLGERLSPPLVGGGIVQRVEALVLSDTKVVRLVLHLQRMAAHTVEVQEQRLLVLLTPIESSQSPGVLPASAAEPQVAGMTGDAPPQAPFLPQPLDETLVTAITFESLAQQSLIVIQTAGAPPRVQVTQRQHPERLALMIHGARLDLTHDQDIPVADPQGVVTKLEALPLHTGDEAQVEIVVHLHTSVPFKVQQDQYVVRLALSAAAPETTAWTPSLLPLAVQTTPSAAPLAVLPVSSTTGEPVMDLQPAMVAPVTSGSSTPAWPDAQGQTPVGGMPLVAQVRQRPPTTTSPAVRAREAPRQYTGEKISLDFQDADIKDLLRLIAEVSGVNIIAGGDVQGTVTTRMVDVPWDQALEVILKINGLDQEREGNIIRVAPLERFTKEREDRLKAQTTEQQTEPLVTRVVPINYTAAGTLKTNLEKLLSERGSLFVDDRTNNMIVTDRQSNITDVLGLIETLDRPTPQVMIEARIVESSRNFLRELGVQIGLLYSQVTDQAFPSRIAVRGAGIPAESEAGTIGSPPGNFLVDLPAAVARGAGGGLGLTLASVGGSLLDIQLSALEASGRGKVISSPRIATLDNTEAVIQSGQRIPYATTSQEGTRTEFVDASLSLKVTPHVTPNDFISLEVTATRNAANFAQTSGGVPSIDTREATTKLLVKDGDTIVIGGLYTRTISDSKDGVPFLSKVPILGWLFQTTRTQDDTQELLIFITPRIIRQAPETPGKTRAVVQ